MPKVTVIMPSLNVAKYIRSCMESVLAQTLQDIEILAVDAGSDDGTLEILQEYAELDKRIKVIHSDRKSYGYQLNMGISCAQGEYVGIVETDDLIAPDMYMTLYNMALKVHADYVKGRAALFIELKNGAEWVQPIGSPVKNNMLGQVIQPQVMPELLVRDIYLWTGIYKREFVNKVILNETPGAAFQDQGFLFQTISSADRAVYLDEVVYKYRQDNSASSIFNRNGFHYLVQEYVYIEKFLKNKNDKWRSVYYQRMRNQCFGRFRTMAASGSFWEEAVFDMEILQKRLAEAVDFKLLRQENENDPMWDLLTLFIKGTRNIYEYYVSDFRRKKERIKELLGIADQHLVIIFGCGALGRFCHAILESKSSHLVVAYCDNNPKLWEVSIQGMPVLSPEDAVQRYPNAVYVITSGKSADMMKQQINGLGVAEKQICVFLEGTDVFLLKNC